MPLAPITPDMSQNNLDHDQNDQQVDNNSDITSEGSGTQCINISSDDNDSDVDDEEMPPASTVGRDWWNNERMNGEGK